jgi:outer membrane murein-binding lipoprotein Lpp
MTTPASDIHADVLDLAQKIVDKVNELVANVETLDANKWLGLADDIDALNNQLQALLIETPEKPSAKSTKS